MHRYGLNGACGSETEPDIEWSQRISVLTVAGQPGRRGTAITANLIGSIGTKRPIVCVAGPRRRRHSSSLLLLGQGFVICCQLLPPSVLRRLAIEFQFPIVIEEVIVEVLQVGWLVGA